MYSVKVAVCSEIYTKIYERALWTECRILFIFLNPHSA